MDINNLSSLVSIIIILSVASERLVDIIKSYIPYLDADSDKSPKESRRRAYLHILSIFSGITTAFLAGGVMQDIIPNGLDSFGGYFALGLLASGGSGFWNSILGYVNEIKKIKKIERKSKN
jgi:hypothetical protein